MAFIRIETRGFDEMVAGVRRMTLRHPTVRQSVLRNLVRQLSDKTKSALNTEGPDTYGFWYEGKLSRSTSGQMVSPNEAIVKQSSLGAFIMYGTSPRPDAKAPPERLLEWAESRRFRSPWAMALAIFRSGILGRNRYHYPPSARGFNYAQWLIEKGAGERLIREAAQQIGDMTVMLLKTEQNINRTIST